MNPVYVWFVTSRFGSWIVGTSLVAKFCRWLVALVVGAFLLGLAAKAHSQTLDPLAAGTFGHGWVGGETVWSTDTDTKVLAVGWTEGQIGFGRVGVAGTVGVLGKVGQLNTQNPSTFEAFRGQIATHYNVFGRGVATCGPAVAAEYSVPLSTDAGQKLYHEVSWGGGAQCSGDFWRVYVLYGQDVQMPGYGVVGYGHFPVSDRISWVARTALGEHHRYVITLDVVARVW